VIADRRDVAEAFVLDVARKTNDPGQSILVFHGGRWQRSRELYRATQQASFEDLVLSGTMKDQENELRVQMATMSNTPSAPAVIATDVESD
jgi:hypothetical protein